MAKDGIYRDSMRGCDLYSNPYDVRMQSHPALIKQRQANFNGKDTISSAQAQLEKEILNKIGNLPIGSILALGKFFFLAIALPPYLVCYKIPKWLVKNGAVKLIRLIVQPAAKITHAVRRGVFAIRTFGKTISSPILLYIKTKVSRTGKLFAYMAGRTKALINKSLKAFKQTIATPLLAQIKKPGFLQKKGRSNKAPSAKNSQNGIIKTFSQLPLKIKKLAAKTIARSTAKLKALTSKLKKNSASAYKKIVHQAKALAVSIIAPILKGIKKSKAVLRKTSLAIVKKTILQPYKKIQLHTAAAVNRMKKRAEKMVLPVRKWLKPKIEAVRNRLQKEKEKILNKAKNIGAALADRTTAGLKKMAEPLIHAAAVIQQPFFSLFSPIAPFFLRPMEAIRKTFSIKRKALIAKVKRMIHAGLKQAKKWMRIVKEACLKAVKKIAKQFLAFTVKVFRGFVWFLSIIAAALKGAFLIITLMLAWATVLIRQGWQSVKIAAGKIG